MNKQAGGRFLFKVIQQDRLHGAAAFDLVSLAVLVEQVQRFRLDGD